MQFEISNFTLTPELEDVTSTEFLQKEQEFCTWQGGVSGLVSYSNVTEEKIAQGLIQSKNSR